MIREIKRLPDSIINKIAAGEVVDRPASVVKELVENAIDANATHIKIEIEASGKELISISDNGCGIANLDMAVDRHATSKLDTEDINKIVYLGFRGEALPAIAAVSNLQIISKTSEAEHAWKIEVCGGQKRPIEPASRLIGTEVRVKNIFSYTPVRLKFMKSDLNERNAISELIRNFALCYPAIKFEYYSEGKRIYCYEAAKDLSKRVEDVFGKSFYTDLKYFSHTGADIKIEGFLGLPTFVHKSNVHQNIFINGRIVRDKIVYSAIKSAYTNIITDGLYPAVILYITIDPYGIDVNVHPSKTEIRLRDPRGVREFIIRSMRNILNNMEAQTSTQVSQHFISKAVSNNYGHSARNINSSFAFRNDAYADPYRFQEETFLSDSVKPSYNTSSTSSANLNDTCIPKLGFARFQINETYIIAENSDGLVIVDQHAAHERLVLEELKKNLGKVKSQSLLIPIVVELTEVLIDKLIEEETLLTELGIEFERLTLHSISIKKIPEVLTQDSIEVCIKDLAVSIMEEGSADTLIHKREAVLGNIACHSSIRAGKKLSIEEMNHLLRRIEETNLSSQCNHGRPTFVILKNYDLSKIFQRT